MKLLIIQACTIAGEEVSAHAPYGSTVDVSKDDAATLTRMGRALYLDKSEDPTKGALTASKDDIATAKEQVAAQAEAEKARTQASAAGALPPGMADIIQSAIQQGIAAGLAAKPAAAPTA